MLCFIFNYSPWEQLIAQLQTLGVYFLVSLLIKYSFPVWTPQSGASSKLRGAGWFVKNYFNLCAICSSAKERWEWNLWFQKFHLCWRIFHVIGFFFSHSKLCHKDCHKANAMRVNRVIMETTDLNCLQFIMELLILTSVMKKHFTGENCKFTFQ